MLCGHSSGDIHHLKKITKKLCCKFHESDQSMKNEHTNRKTYITYPQHKCWGRYNEELFFDVDKK